MEGEYGMTRKEEISKQALKYGEPEYLLQTPNILGTQGFIQGAKWADNTMIEKACEWLCMNMTSLEYFGINGNISKPDFIQRFKKAMKEE